MYIFRLITKNNIMILLIIIIVLLVLVLIMPIKVQVVYVKDESRERKYSDINFYFVKFFNKKIDLDSVIRVLTRDENDDVSISKLIYNIQLFILGKNINKTLLKMVYVDKVTALFTTNSIYQYVLYNNIISLSSMFINGYTKDVGSEYYSVLLKENRNSNFEIIFYIRGVYALFAIIANIKDLIKIRKFIKYRRKELGAINK